MQFRLLLLVRVAFCLKTPITWLIDGNNLKCSRGVPTCRETLIRDLKLIASPKNIEIEDRLSNVVLVFDGGRHENFRSVICPDKWFECIIADGTRQQKDRADDLIVDRVLPKIQEEFYDGEIHVVTADKELQKRARATRCMKRGSSVDPQKFWKQYMPSLKFKQQGHE